MTQLSAAISVLLVPSLVPGRPEGGAEAVADFLIRKILSDHQVMVFHGRRAPANRPETSVGFSGVSMSAFDVTERVSEGGLIDWEKMCPEAQKHILSSSCVITIERVLAGLRGVPRIAVLGGVAYRHCQEVAVSGEYNELVVPSQFVKQRAAQRWSVPDGKITVIPNGIDDKLFVPTRQYGSSDEIVLLVPHRMDPGKGWLESIGFARACQEAGHTVIVKGLVPRDFARTPLGSQVQQMATGLDARWSEWVARDEMPAVYASASLTLCLGTFPEGFGLVAAESIACGTPVLARRRGATAEVLPDGAGVVWFDDYEEMDLARVLPDIVAQARVDCLRRGSRHVRQHFSQETMRSRYLERIAQVLR